MLLRYEEGKRSITQPKAQAALLKKTPQRLLSATRCISLAPWRLCGIHTKLSTYKRKEFRYEIPM